MSSGEREAGRCVIPICRIPGCRGVARLALSAKLCEPVIRVVFRAIRLLVARNTRGLSPDVSAGMTGQTQQRCVCAGQREIRGIMVEVGRLPGCRRVALRAIVAEIL